MAHAAIPTDLQIVRVPIDDLHPHPANPRKISDAELDALTRSLREFGFVQPVIARHDDHIVVGGHQRLVAARRLGLKTVPTIFVDLSAERSHLLNLALNKISGDWDEQLLARMLADFKTHPPDLIAIFNHPTPEYGAAFFGKDYAVELGRWIRENYEPEIVFDASTSAQRS